MKSWHCIIEQLISPVRVSPIFLGFPVIELSAGLRSRMSAPGPARTLDRARHVFGDGCCELNEFAAWRFNREAMLVIATRRIRAKCRDTPAVGIFDCL